jgi:hypothetical protein
MKNLLSVIFIFTINGNTIFGQNISGIVIDEKSNLPVAYVNIGVSGKNTGTVSDVIGRFHLRVDSINADEPVLFTCIGYLPVSIKIEDLKNTANKNILMQKKYYELGEVVINPKLYKQQILGVITRSHFLNLTWVNNRLGYECGILMKIKKSAVIKRVNINISECTYDTIFCRLNIYRTMGEMNFENILTSPIYINLSKDQTNDKISIDLQSYNIVVDGDFLVTLELVKDLGRGHLYFCGSFTNKTYSRRSSQGKWESGKPGVSISVEADVEK